MIGPKVTLEANDTMIDLAVKAGVKRTEVKRILATKKWTNSCSIDGVRVDPDENVKSWLEWKGHTGLDLQFRVGDISFYIES